MPESSSRRTSMNNRRLIVDATPDAYEMVVWTLEASSWRRMFSKEYSPATTVTLKESHVKNKEVSRLFNAMTAATTPPERRCEGRGEYRCRCSYEVAEAIDREVAFFEYGEAFALNRSVGGMLLVMGHALHVAQLVEVQAFHSQLGRTVNVCEARWTRPIQVESLGNLYLVGCRRLFGLITILRSE